MNKIWNKKYIVLSMIVALFVLSVIPASAQGVSIDTEAFTTAIIDTFNSLFAGLPDWVELAGSFGVIIFGLPIAFAILYFVGNALLGALRSGLKGMGGRGN